MIALGKIHFKSHLDCGEKFSLIKTASECDRVTQGDRKLGQGGPCSIYIREKSHRLHSYRSKRFFWSRQKVSLCPILTGVKSFFLSETAFECVRVAQGDRKLGQGGPCSIYTREKSQQLHSGPPKKSSRRQEVRIERLYLFIYCTRSFTYLV